MRFLVHVSEVRHIKFLTEARESHWRQYFRRAGVSVDSRGEQGCERRVCERRI